MPRLAFYFVSKLSPISCVDLLPYRVMAQSVEIGLIERRDARGHIGWNLIGGGIHRRESVAEAAARHMYATLGPGVVWAEPDYSRPDAVEEYFPVRRAAAGYDPRKHAIALTYAVPLSGQVSARDEAITFRWFPEDALPFDNMGFGQDIVLSRMLPIAPSAADQP